MRAEVVGVGTELLLGDIVNSNAAWISRELARIGWTCHRHSVVGDNVERIAALLEEAAVRADAVVVTGGLGPTQDDVTREALSAATGRALRRDPALCDDLRARFAAMGRAMAEMNLRQADVPEGARVIGASFGTAPGLILEHGETVFCLVPGVPAEMRDMLHRGVLPELAARAGAPAIVSRVVRTSGVPESAVAEILAPMWDSLTGVTMAFLAGGGEVRVRLTSSAPDAETLLKDAVERVAAMLGSAVIGYDEQTLEVAVGALLRDRGLTLAAAESLTAGGLGARITTVPGASDYFRGSIIAYAVEAKVSLLGVDAELLRGAGPVDEEVARQMAEGARRAFAADVGVAITGVAGPAEHGGRPAGVVALAVASAKGSVTREVKIPGDRDLVRERAAAAALNLLRLHLTGGDWPAFRSPSD